jgi:hypothetical protein
MDGPPKPLDQARAGVPGVQIAWDQSLRMGHPPVVGGRRDPGHRRRHFPLRTAQTGVIGAPSSGENGLLAHTGVDPEGAVVECVAEGGVGARRATGALVAPCGVERETSFTLVVIASVIKIANTAAIKLTATGRGGWK